MWQALGMCDRRSVVGSGVDGGLDTQTAARFDLYFCSSAPAFSCVPSTGCHSVANRAEEASSGTTCLVLGANSPRKTAVCFWAGGPMFQSPTPHVIGQQVAGSRVSTVFWNKCSSTVPQLSRGLLHLCRFQT